MNEKYTIFICDVCGKRTEDERKFVVFLPSFEEPDHHVCRDCINSFRKMLRKEDQDAG